ncbi:unnamed protein product [Caenorhabditis bovis]|uniref:EF-hand domain-containing protein n=1 Tax=Caenorhabditis bovis TaxID=2654633 RepID=A0A8S1F5L8_9PELO|nr:unnamed protein product [Caenorhabditis bovis]
MKLFNSLSLLTKRSEHMTEFEKNFNERVIGILEETRATNLQEFRKNAQRFIDELRLHSFSDENGYKFITIMKLSHILRKSPPDVVEMLPLSMVMALIKMTAYNGAIDILLIDELVKTYVHCETIYIKLLPYAENNKEISSYELQQFITACYVPLMKNKPENVEYYAAYIVGIIFFIVDSRRKEFALIQDILTSTLLFHLETCIQFDNGVLQIEPHINFFSIKCFQSALHEFRSLDVDRNGVLSQSEMLVFRYSFFNQVFIKRVFEISQTYEGGFLDFKGFVDLITAIHFRHTKASAKYHFEAFDLKNDGYLDEEEIRELCLVLHECIPAEEAVPDADVLTVELMDMIKCKDRISLDEFLASKMRTTFTGFISNYQDWYKYERREQ